jgi:hypothetical protein
MPAVLHRLAAEIVGDAYAEADGEPGTHGRIGACRSTPGWHSHDFADAIIRDAIRAPWLRASSPTTGACGPPGPCASCHGSRVSCGARSISPARYTNDGNWRRGATSPGATSCGTSNTRTRGSAASVSTYATAEFVVPRSMPIRKRAGTALRSYLRATRVGTISSMNASMNAAASAA